jgi:hypothetical protein
MRYKDHLPFFDGEIATLGQRPFNLPFRTLFEVLRSNGSQEADEACRVFASTLTWPQVSDAVRFELCMRLSCARWWCTELTDDDTYGEPGREFLESLLIEYWRDVGRQDWLHENYCLTPEEKAQQKRWASGT